MNKNHGEERRNRILEMRQRGMKLAEIGREFGISRQRVFSIIAHEPVVRRTKYRKDVGKKLEQLQRLSSKLNEELAVLMSNYIETEIEHNQDK